jgi:dTDP-4-dehydrorhamnose 3,5-epimerase
MIDTVLPLALPGAFRIRLRRFTDPRGCLVKFFQEKAFHQLGLETELKECYFSISVQGVLRGLHFQTPPCDHAKMVFCLAGHVHDVLVDLRIGQSTYGCHELLDLDAEKPDLIYIPRGLAHGFLAISQTATMMYLVTSMHSPEHDAGIRWDSCGIDWGVKLPILSERDRQFPRLADFHSPFTNI